MTERETVKPFPKIDTRLIKFSCVGVVNTLFGYSMFSLFIFIGFHYPSAILMSAAISILFNFKTIGHLVFNNCDNKLMCRFLFVYALIAALNILLLDCELKLKINIYIAGAILLMPLGLLSFILNKNLVFKESYEEN